MVGEKSQLDFASLFKNIEKGVLAYQLWLISDAFALLDTKVQHTSVLP